MKNILLILLITCLSIVNSFAKEQNFYLVAKATPEGVYLRWDAVDGNFPDHSNVSLFVLKRNGSTIATFNPHALMSLSQIQALYQKPENKVSLKKVISNISQNTDPSCQGANLSNFAQKIQGCMQNKLWNKLAAKTDFTIASIAHRAYLDTQAGTSSVEYELLAMNDQNASQRLGKITLDSSNYTHVLGAQNFKQVSQLDANVSCLSVEYAKDDYTVSLSWENGGSKTDAFANSMMLAGYDLYRSTKGDIELTDLSKTTATDANGDYVFTNLEKINAVPILLANSEGEDTPLYMETQDSLRKAGLKPSDSRFYYLVARDFTGAYGPTIITKITVPNTLPPVTPWAARAIESEGNIQLVWEHVNIKNYVKHYKNTRKFCNTSTFTVSTRLKFVDNGALCGASELSVNLNVDKYYIYRFDSPLVASKFSDADLDGIADIEESPENRCKKSTPQGTALVKILDAQDFDKGEFVRFTDSSIPKSTYYWYRIAAISKSGISTSGISSILTMPIRAMIPDRTLPQKPDVTLKTCKGNYEIKLRDFNETYNVNYIAVDKTKNAKQIRLSFIDINDTYGETYMPFDSNNRIEINPIFFGFVCTRTKSFKIEFLDTDDNVLESFESGINDTIGECLADIAKTYTLKSNCILEEDIDNTKKYTPVTDGEDLFSYPVIELNTSLKANECLEFSINVGSKRHKIARRCDGKQIYDVEDFNLSNLGQGEKYCIGMTVYNANNQHSATKYLPCFGKVDESKPNKPNILSMELEGATLSFSWILPQEKIASTIVSVYNEHNDSDAYMRTYAHPDHINTGTEISKTINISTSGDITQKWCAKAKSVGFNGKSSEWSTVRCAEDNGNIVGLAWPKISNVTKDNNITNFYYTSTNLGPKHLGIVGSDLRKLFTPLSLIDDISFEGDLYIQDSNADFVINEFTVENIKAQLKLAFSATSLQFIFYRQENSDNGWSNFIQISPLVSTVKGLRLMSERGIKEQRIIFSLDQNLFIAFKANGQRGDALLFYADNYPYKSDTTYRYVKVHFDKDYEIDNYSISNEVHTGGTQ